MESAVYVRRTTSSAVPKPGVLRTLKPPSIDDARARMFRKPCPAVGASGGKPSPSSSIGDEPLARGAPADHDLGVGCVRVTPDVPEPFLDDAEDLDLLVRSEADRLVDLEVDGELAVGGQELDVAAQRGVEWGGPTRRRQRRGWRIAPPAARALPPP